MSPNLVYISIFILKFNIQSIFELYRSYSRGVTFLQNFVSLLKGIISIWLSSIDLVKHFIQLKSETSLVNSSRKVKILQIKANFSAFLTSLRSKTRLNHVSSAKYRFFHLNIDKKWSNYLIPKTSTPHCPIHSIVPK